MFQQWEAREGPGQDHEHIEQMLAEGIVRPAVTVLVVTFNRLEYSRIAIPALLESKDVIAHYVVWDNASTDGTREWLVEQYANDPRVTLVFSPRNTGVVHPMNVIWQTADTPFVAKVDNDTLVPRHLLRSLVECYLEFPQIGVLSGCHFRKEDLDSKIIQSDASGVYRQPHVGGCAVLIRTSLLHEFGPIVTQRLATSEPFLDSGWTDYQQRLHAAGYRNGYCLPLVYVDHMEDTRSTHFIGTEVHERYKRSMRQQSLADCTEKFFINGATKLRDRGDVIVTGDGLGDGELTLCVPLSGRRALWPELSRFLDKQSFRRERMRLLLLDTSQDSTFGDDVRRWLLQSDYRDFQVATMVVGPRGIADAPRRDHTPVVQQAMAQIYSRLQQELCTEFVWILEDDILPPEDVCERLLSSLQLGVASVAAPYRSRFGARFVAWDSAGRNIKLRGHQVESTAGNGFGCVLIRSATFLRHRFLEAEDVDRGFYRFLSATSESAVIDWSIEVEHRDVRTIDPDTTHHQPLTDSTLLIGTP